VCVLFFSPPCDGEIKIFVSIIISTDIIYVISRDRLAKCALMEGTLALSGEYD